MVAMLVLAVPASAEEHGPALYIPWPASGNSPEAQGAADVVTLNKQVIQLSSQGKYKEAAAIEEKALALAERVLGPEHPDTLKNVSVLAGLYARQVRYSEAEPLFERALAASERVLGPEHPDTLKSLMNLASLYRAQGRYSEAEPLFKRALAASERALGPEHPDTLKRVINLAALYQAQGRYGEAEPLFKRTLAANERLQGPEHPDTLISVHNLGAVYYAQGRYSEAEPLYRRALASRERVLGPQNLATAQSVGSLGGLYTAQGRYSEAEPLFKRALAVREHVQGLENPATLRNVNNLATLYQFQGRYGEAEPLIKRALAARERVLGLEHPETLAGMTSLATLYQAQGRYGEAEPLYQRALAAYERVLGPEHPDTLRSVHSLGALYRLQGRYDEAEPLYQRALEARERVLGPEHPQTLVSVQSLGALYQAQGRYAQAEPLYQRALAAQERALGPAHPDTLKTVNGMGALYYEQQDWERAAQFWQRSTAAIAGHVQWSAQDATQALSGNKKSEAEQNSTQFQGLVRAMYRLAPEGTPDAGASLGMFETAQWALSSEAAASLRQMAARGAKGDPKLAALVRERQDLIAEWQARDALRNAALGQEAAKRSPQAEAENTTRQAAIDPRIKEIDAELAAKFPDYAALSSPAPLAAGEVQAQLGAHEALVLFLDLPEGKATPEETFIWVVTKTDIRWVRSELGTAALAREVQGLRCGLDAEAWADGHCVELTGQHYTEADRQAGKPLPFDHARAFRLYRALFGQVEDLIKGKQLLIVPSGALTQLPFQVLVTAPPASGHHRSAAWLIRDHALTVLPAVSSLKALRRLARRGAASKPMIGFGNPLLDGDQNHPKFGAYYKKLAQRARAKQACPEVPWERVASSASRRGVTPVQARGGFADVAFLRQQEPLPETADELCAVARDVHADLSEIRLGKRATEREVKRLSETGQLARYRIVHFATHGALAGQVQGNAEPGLLLTPPAEASEEDDGYLTASEIAGLKLDADWVILSACNTAAGGAQGAEALSGLARAFIYAQARALLVSHWEVNSVATVKLVTGAMSRLAANKSMGRAEAMRQSMLALIDKGEPREAHPAFWAPFVVVGEGGAGR
ncbi:MAG: tetratricopeptide repeat protein [Rhodomicrobium sp.]